MVQGLVNHPTENNNHINSSQAYLARTGCLFIFLGKTGDLQGKSPFTGVRSVYSILYPLKTILLRYEQISITTSVKRFFISLITKLRFTTLTKKGKKDLPLFTNLN